MAALLEYMAVTALLGYLNLATNLEVSYVLHYGGGCHVEFSTGGCSYIIKKHVDHVLIISDMVIRGGSRS